MKTNNLKLFAIVTVLFALGTGSAFAEHKEGPCKDKRESKRLAHESLHQCIRSWGQDGKPGDVDPTDDCNQKLSSFIQSSKDLKTCRLGNVKK